MPHYTLLRVGFSLVNIYRKYLSHKNKCAFKKGRYLDKLYLQMFSTARKKSLHLFLRQRKKSNIDVTWKKKRLSPKIYIITRGMVLNLWNITLTSQIVRKNIHQSILCHIVAFGRMQFITISFGIRVTDLQYEGYEK